MTQYKNGNKSSSQFTATPDKYPQGKFNPKPCRWCSVTFSPVAPSHLYCCDVCANKAYDERLLQRTYSISRKDYVDMLNDQNSKCKICDGPGFLMGQFHKTKLVIDHDHKTNDVRGLLCHNCNRALGLFKDKIENLKSAIEYLEGATTIPQGSTLK